MAAYRNGFIREIRPIRKGLGGYNLKIQDKSGQLHRVKWKGGNDKVEAKIKKHSSGGPGGPKIPIEFFTRFDDNQNVHWVYLR